MKRQTFIRELEQAGCEFVRHGKRHDLYRNPGNGQQAPYRVTGKLRTRYAK